MSDYPAETAIGLRLKFYAAIMFLKDNGTSCDGSEKGYQCLPRVSHYWGQYSPYFTIPSEIPDETPDQCQITFAQVLSRHAARDPTLSHTVRLGTTVSKIKKDVKFFPGKYAFLADYEYTLGADQLTVFGQQEMVFSGIKFYNRYGSVANSTIPFVRASGQKRVVDSAQNFTQGFHAARLADKPSSAPEKYPYPILVLSEEKGFNNTLSHDLCDGFESGAADEVGENAQKQWADIFTPPIRSRLNTALKGANLTERDVRHMMDLCPFNTVASISGKISPFCDLFSDSEWKQYDYYQSLGKYYGFANGNPLGPTQGVGFVNELVARMTNQPVNDHTSVNHTLDDSLETFPIGDGHVLFADFSHDNDMTTIYAALGLYNASKPLSNTSLEDTIETKGYSASWSVPFAARAYFEKMNCAGEDEELVRVLINDRVIPLETCGGDKLGRCKLHRFVESLSFARGGGLWDKCFV